MRYSSKQSPRDVVKISGKLRVFEASAALPKALWKRHADWHFIIIKRINHGWANQRAISASSISRVSRVPIYHRRVMDEERQHEISSSAAYHFY